MLHKKVSFETHLPYLETPVALTASNHSSTSLSTLLPDAAGGAVVGEAVVVDGAVVVVRFVASSPGLRTLRAQLRSQYPQKP